jgi:hypothetical protein
MPTQIPTNNPNARMRCHSSGDARDNIRMLYPADRIHGVTLIAVHAVRGRRAGNAGVAPGSRLR